jgi:hypothetical protein
MLALDAACIRRCHSLRDLASGALKLVDAAASEAIRDGSRPGAPLKATWAGMQLRCFENNSRLAKQVIWQARFTVDTALKKATSTDDLFYIWRMFEVLSGGCRGGSSPW